MKRVLGIVLLSIPFLAGCGGGHYRFEEGAAGSTASGTGSILDSSGAGNHGDPSGGPTYSSEVPTPLVPRGNLANTRSLSFDGVDDQVFFNPPAAFPFHDPVDATLEFYIKFTPVAHQSVFWTRGDNTDADRFNIHVNGDGTFGFDYRSPSGALHCLVSAIGACSGSGAAPGVPISPGVWTHLAIVRTGATYTVYKDGAVAATITDSSPDLPVATSWTLSGRSTNRFQGMLDEVRVTNTALPPGQFLNAWDADFDYSDNTNPGGPWSYGYTTTLGGTFNLFTDHEWVRKWNPLFSPSLVLESRVEPSVYRNISGSVEELRGNDSHRPGVLMMRHGPSGEFSVVRWSAPLAGNYRIAGSFEGLDYAGPTTTDVHLRLNSTTSLFSGNINGFGGNTSRAAGGSVPTLGFSTTQTLAASDTIDLVVGAGASGFLNDSTGAQATITLLSLPSADLALTKTAPASVIAGGSVGYTLTVTNNGPNPASGVTLTDTLPGGAAFVLSTPSQGSCSGTSTVTCNLGTINNSASATVTIDVTAVSAGSLVNTAAVTSSVPDPIPANNSATATTTVSSPSADLRITKVAPTSGFLGSTIIYTIQVQNLGPSSAAGATVSDALPATANLVSASSGCTGTRTITCTTGTILSGATVSFNLTVQPTAGGTLSNTATVSSVTTDPVPGNNTSTATTAVSVPTTCGGGSGGTICGTSGGGTLFPPKGAPVIFSFKLNRSIGGGGILSFGSSGGVSALRICRGPNGFTLVVVRGGAAALSRAPCPP
jgi:uncharacterized repeat protein (TIGR01451 family)